MAGTGGKRKGAGRPLTGSEKLDTIVRTSISAQDNERLQAVSKKSGQKASELTREFILKGLARKEKNLAQRSLKKIRAIKHSRQY